MDKNISKMLSFEVSPYGETFKLTPTLSKGRLKIFYKGENRNSSFIDDTFGNHLLQTAAYTPVVGIYNKEEEDFEAHANEGESPLIYGVVPENYNPAWENHVDEDGVVREYACCDVLLWTQIHKEANEIIGKKQSMELYSESIKGEWEYINGRRVFRFSEGSFLGLSVLGDTVEPCFEGSAFFSFLTSFSRFIEEIQDYNNKNGDDTMKDSQKFSDTEKDEKMDVLLDSELDEKEEIKEEIKEEVKEEVTLEDSSLNEEEDAAEMAEKFESLKAEHEALQAAYEALKEASVVSEEEKTALEVEKVELENQLNDMNSEREVLQAYKLENEAKEKEGLIKSYAHLLSSEVVADLQEKISSFTFDSLKREIAVFVLDTPSNFSQEEGDKKYTKVSKTDKLSGASKIVSDFKNKKGGNK